MPEPTRKWVYEDDLTWYSFRNLTAEYHCSVINMLNIALAHANKLKILPVSCPENIRWDYGFTENQAQYSVVSLTKLDEPSDCEIKLVESTLRTILQLQAVPFELYACVQKALHEALLLVCERDESWVNGMLGSKEFGISYSYDTVKSAVDVFNSEALLFYEEHNPVGHLPEASDLPF